MPRPGTDIEIVDAAVPGGAILDTGQAFFAGQAERGPVDSAQTVSGIKDYAAKYGSRMGGSLLYDAVGAYFSEGGGTLYVSRISGPAATAAGGDFGELVASAVSPGVWGNDLKIDAVAPTIGTGITIVVSEDGVAQERSPALTAPAQAVAWADAHSSRVSFDATAATVLPAAATSTTLTGGADDNTWTDTAVTDALDRFEYGFGPGQVAVPGMYTAAAPLLAHVNKTRRVALIDLVDSDDPTELVTEVQSLEGVDGVRFAAAFAPWALYPGPAGSTITVPYSGIQAGLIATADRGGNPNQPAAGVAGISRYALGLSQDFTDDEREALNDAGVTMAKIKYGQVRTYGERTAAGPLDDNWLDFGGSRLIMAIAHQCDAVAENYVFHQIDGRRGVFAALQSDLKGVCLPYWTAGALFGATPQEAFSVDTGPTVNTIDTIKAREIHAVVRLRCSPAAEWVPIEIVKVPVEVNLAPLAVAA